MFISSCQAGQNVQHWVCQPLVGGVHPRIPELKSETLISLGVGTERRGRSEQILALDMYVHQPKMAHVRAPAADVMKERFAAPA